MPDAGPRGVGNVLAGHRSRCGGVSIVPLYGTWFRRAVLHCKRCCSKTLSDRVHMQSTRRGGMGGWPEESGCPLIQGVDALEARCLCFRSPERSSSHSCAGTPPPHGGSMTHPAGLFLSAYISAPADPAEEDA